MTINHIDFSSIGNKNNFFSVFKYNLKEFEIDEDENSEGNFLFNQGNLCNNFLNINYFSPLEIDNLLFSSSREQNFMKSEKQNTKEYDIKNKTKAIFQVNDFIPEPFLEHQINAIIRIMNINKVEKEKYFLETKDLSNKIYLVRNKIMLKPNERRKHLKRKNIQLKSKNKEEAKVTTKTGRKKKSDGTVRYHNKYSPDNLFSKTKNIINKSLIEFINILINNIYTREKIKMMFLELNIKRKKFNSKLIKVIKNNQYNFIKDKKKNVDIFKLFTLTVKEYLCNEISTKYKKLPYNYNEKVITWLLKDDNNKNIFDFIFNKLKIEEWVDIFLYKNKLKGSFDFNLINQNSQKIIKENIIGIDYYFKEIYLDNKGNADKDYFHCFLLLMYNLRRYIMIKEKRNCQKK